MADETKEATEKKEEGTKEVKPFWSRTSTKVGVLVVSHAACIAAGFYYGAYMSGSDSAAEISADDL